MSYKSRAKLYLYRVVLSAFMGFSWRCYGGRADRKLQHFAGIQL